MEADNDYLEILAHLKSVESKQITDETIKEIESYLFQQAQTPNETDEELSNYLASQDGSFQGIIPAIPECSIQSPIITFPIPNQTKQPFILEQECLNNNEHHHKHVVIIDAESLPVLEYLKYPVSDINELYKRYPDGGQTGQFCIDTVRQQFITWNNTAKKWEYVDKTNSQLITELWTALDKLEKQTRESITEVSSKVNYTVEILSVQGNIFKNGVISTMLSARVFHGGDDITDTLNENLFQWTRKSANEMEDSLWNAAHFGGTKSIEVTKNDVWQKATFSCAVNI